MTDAVRLAARLEPPQGALDDFDFLIGDWTVANRRLRNRWTDAAHWESFPATHRLETRLDGAANVDEMVFTSQGIRGLTLRLYDAAARRLSIYWVDSRSGQLTPPVHGGFTGNLGEFYGEDLDDGRFVAVRFRWLKRGAHGGPHWEQAFSLDGQAWETNWTMDFSRAAA